MSLRFHEISERRHRILNPFTDDKLRLLGEICDLHAGASMLDLCCGKGEMLATWAARHEVRGVGVDISSVFLAAARERVAQLGVEDRVRLVEGDAVEHVRSTSDRYDVVSCIGATWIGDGLVGTIELLEPRLADGGTLLIGEPYWIEPLPAGVAVDGVGPDDFTSLAGTHDRFTACGFELVEMVLADGDSWDRYVASQWRTVADWLLEHPSDPDAAELRDWIARGRRSYLAVERRHLGWGVFVLRRAA